MDKKYITKSYDCQQLKVISLSRNIQPMVINDSDKQEFSNRFNAVLDAAGITKFNKGRQGILAKMFGVSGNGARKWLQGESIPRYEKLLVIIERFKDTGVTVEWLLSGNPDLSPFQKAVLENQGSYKIKDMEMPAWKIPIINWVKAGEFTECVESYWQDEAAEWVGTTTKPKTNTFALRIKGDSMEPLFTEGMLIIIEPEFEALPGDYIIAKNGNEATFKQLIKDGSDYYLKPLNERYPIKPLGDSKIIGVVREAVHKFR